MSDAGKSPVWGYIIAWILYEMGVRLLGQSDYSFLQWGDWKALGIVLAIVVVFVFFFSRMNQKEGEEGRKKFLTENYLPYVTAAIKDQFNKLPWFAKHIEPRYKTPDGHDLIILRKLRVELITLMNYLLRLEVYGAKKNAVVELDRKFEHIRKGIESENYKGAKETRAAARIKSDAYEYCAGAKIGQYRAKSNNLKWQGNIVPDGLWRTYNWYFDRIHEGGKRDSRQLAAEGYSTLKYCVHFLMNGLKQRLENVNDLAKAYGSTEFQGKLQQDWKNTRTGPWLDKSIHRHESFQGLANNYGRMLGAHALSWQALDQNNIGMAGWYKHQYKFARASARPRVIEVDFTELQKGILKPIKDHGQVPDPVKTIADGEFGIDSFLFEVDMYGRFMDDMNHLLNVTAKGGPGVSTAKASGAVYRQAYAEDIFPISSFEAIYSSIIKDWDMWQEDVRDGLFHPHSKTAFGYARCIENGLYDFDTHYQTYNLEKTPGPGSPAFDLEALKDPGAFQFRGKKHYFEEVLEGEPENKFPGLSVNGLSMYIRTLMRRKSNEPEIVDQCSTHYVWPGPKGENWFVRDVKDKAPKGDSE
jgi:hypothetical protein